MIEDTISGEDGLVRAANIRTSTGRTNRPITKLYPLEVTTTDLLLKQNSENVPASNSNSAADHLSNVTEETRPVRQAALKGRQQVQEWAKALCGPPEDAGNY